MSVTIAGAVVSLLAGTLDIDDQLGQRSTARLTVRDPGGVLSFRRGEQVEISDEGKGLTAWTGYVDSSDETRLTPQGARRHAVTCIDQQYLADKRIAAATYGPDTTCGDVARDLHANYLAAEGVTLGTVEDGATLSAGMVVNYQPVSAALDALVDASDGFVWLVDSDKVLSFRHKSSVAAPWQIGGEGTVLANPDPTVTHGNPDYRDTEYVLGGLDVTDPQTETRMGDGATTAWPMSFPLAEAPTITVNGVAQTVGVKGVDDEAGYDFGWNVGDAIISQASGTTPLAAADTLSVTYRGQFAVVARIDAPDQIDATRAVEGGTGIVEHATSAPDVTSRAAAFATGKATLASYAVAARTLKFDTDRPGLATGQWASVNLPDLGLSNVSMLIQSVTCQDISGGYLRWSITAVDGPTALPWAKVLAPTPPVAKADLVSVGGGSVLALLATFARQITWAHEVDEPTIQACDLFPLTFPATLC